MGSKYTQKLKLVCFIRVRYLLLENSIRGLEEDETDFLARMDDAKLEKQRQLKRMEREEIEELKISFFFRLINIQTLLLIILFSLILLYTKLKRN